ISPPGPYLSWRMKRLAIRVPLLMAACLATTFADGILIEPRASFFTDDFQFGGRVGGESRALNALPVALFADFEFRPYGRATRVRTSPSFSYQFREHRYTFGPGALVSLPVT